jgi:hypothetical protein
VGRYDKCRVVVPARQAGNLFLGSLKGLQTLALESNVQSSLHRIVYGTDSREGISNLTHTHTLSSKDDSALFSRFIHDCSQCLEKLQTLPGCSCLRGMGLKHAQKESGGVGGC